MVEAAFIDTKTVAAMIGMSEDTFYRKRKKMIATGFPAGDPIIGKYCRADVEAWIASRARFEPPPERRPEPKFNYDAL